MAITLTKTVLKSGVWHGRAARDDGAAHPAPRLSAWHQNDALDAPEVVATKETGQWDVHLTLPARLLSDGVQTVLFRDDESGDTVGSFTLVAGDALDDDIRAEMALLRAELDMLKKAFRRHVSEGVG
ncbi:MAG: hypothetical protein AAGA87_02205 [Pseudomonadota bacterium]